MSFSCQVFSSLCILDPRLLSDLRFANIFSHFVDFLFVSVLWSTIKFNFDLIKFNLSIFFSSVAYFFGVMKIYFYIFFMICTIWTLKYKYFYLFWVNFCVWYEVSFQLDIFHVDILYFQHLLNAFLHWMVLVSWKDQLTIHYVFISAFSILFHLPVCVLLCQYAIVLIVAAV